MRARRALVMSPWPWMYSMAGGGGTPIDADTLFALRDEGYDVDLVVPPGDRASGFDAVEGLTVHRIGAVRIPNRGIAGRYLTWLERTLRFTGRGLLVARRGRRPDLFYGMSSLTMPAAWACARVFRRPVVGLLFGTFLYPKLDRLPRMLMTSFEETVAFKTPVDRLVVLDDGTRGDRVAAWFGVRPERLRFWMHGIDREACAQAVAAAPGARERLGLPADGPLAVSASRLADWKRVDRIVRAWPAVVAAAPGATLAISGAGPDREALEALAADLGVAESVVFLGPLPRDANLALIAAADVFCSFYDFSNTGVALLEALSCGVTPVVADSGATSELVQDGISGLVVPPDDDAAAARAIAAVMTDADLRERLSAGARQLAAERIMSVQDRKQLEYGLLAELVPERA